MHDFVVRPVRWKLRLTWEARATAMTTAMCAIRSHFTIQDMSTSRRQRKINEVISTIVIVGQHPQRRDMINMLALDGHIVHTVGAGDRGEGDDLEWGVEAAEAFVGFQILGREPFSL